MLEDGRDCAEVVTQSLRPRSTAGFKIVAMGCNSA